jgi:acrylyl-CoA reductase (NADPH)
MFKALVLRKEDAFTAQIESLSEDALPQGDVFVQVHYSTLNYKDALAITNTAPVVRQWPMVAGIDGAGVVLRSDSAHWREGQAFVHNGWGLGETRFGLLSERANLESKGLVHLPSVFTPLQAMAIGTAGYTAMLSVMALERHGLKPGDGEVLVTGATGGVGSVAVALLSSLGYTVVASTGKASEANYLKSLGASDVIDRAELSVQNSRPLQKERWAGVVDSVGSHTLVNALAQTRYSGVVSACGLAQGFDLPSTVMPFILRGVSLLGIDSVMAPLPLRIEAWERLAKDMDSIKLGLMTRVIAMQEVIEVAHALRQGQIKGRVVVKVS